MKEQVINSLRSVGKCIWMTSVGYQAGLHFPTAEGVTNDIEVMLMLTTFKVKRKFHDIYA